MLLSPRGRSVRLERALTDFGCEHSFGHAAARVMEHYGFEISSSAVREATLTHAQRGAEKLEEQYQEPFRLLPLMGAEHVVVEADGTMICTVAPGKRNGKRPRDWKEMRLTAAQAQGKEETFYAATFSGVDEVGRRWGHCARNAGWGLNSQIHALGDGAEWIRLQTREVFGRQRARDQPTVIEVRMEKTRVHVRLNEPAVDGIRGTSHEKKRVAQIEKAPHVR